MMKEAWSRKRGDEGAFPGESTRDVGGWKPATAAVSSAVQTEAVGSSRALTLTVARTGIPGSEAFTSVVQQEGPARTSAAEYPAGRQQQEALAPSPPTPQGMAHTAPKAGDNASTITVNAARPFFTSFLVIYLSIVLFSDSSTSFFRFHPSLRL
jgi:hypothetical protein